MLVSHLEEQAFIGCLRASRPVSLIKIMKTFRPEQFVELSRFLTAVLTPPDGWLGSDEAIIGKKDKAFARDVFPHFEEICTELHLIGASATCRKITALHKQRKATFGQFRELAKELHGRLIDEFEASIFMSIDADKVRLFTEKQLFGADVESKFPRTVVDIEEAGKCFAVGRHTATVFHLMRVMEVGLQGFATQVGVQRTQDTNWQPIIDQATKAVLSLPATTPKEKQRKAKYHAVLAHLSNVKTAWRNEVMHPKATYTEEQAEEIFNNVRGFMRELAALMKARR
jgi:hypothetical protein